MPQVIERDAGSLSRERERAIKVFAKSMYRELKNHGHDTRQIVAVATELIRLVTDEMKEPESESESESDR